MQLLSIMLNVIAPIMLVMSIGYLIGKKFNPDPRSISVFLIYLFTPSLVFKGVYQAELSGALFGVAGVALSSAVSMAIIGFLVARFLNYTTREESSLILTITLVNAANYGISLNTFAYGDVGGGIAIFYYVVSALIGNVFGVFFASRGTVPVTDALSNVFKVPILYAAIIGLILNYYNVELPLILSRSIIDIAAPASIPLMLGLLGLQLSRVQFGKNVTSDEKDPTLASKLSAVLLASGLKLLVAPFIAIGFALLFGLSGLNFNVAVLESSMPTAVLASALATQFGGDARFVSAVTLVGTLASILTLSVLIFLLGGTV